MSFFQLSDGCGGLSGHWVGHAGTAQAHGKVETGSGVLGVRGDFFARNGYGFGGVDAGFVQTPEVGRPGDAEYRGVASVTDDEAAAHIDVVGIVMVKLLAHLDGLAVALGRLVELSK